MSLFQEEEVMDIVASLIDAMGHSGVLDEMQSRFYAHGRCLSLLEKLRSHPLFRAAEQRRRNKFWANAEKAAKRVEEWPDWKKGTKKSR
jgi:hypothetical protein